MAKSREAFRTIREVADWLDVAAHVLRFWESKFSQIKPLKRAGGRRYYRPEDMELVGGIKVLLHERGMTIRGVQRLIREQGVAAVTALSPSIDDTPFVDDDAEWKVDTAGTAAKDAAQDPVPEAQMAEFVEPPRQTAEIAPFPPRERIAEAAPAPVDAPVPMQNNAEDDDQGDATPDLFAAEPAPPSLDIEPDLLAKEATGTAAAAAPTAFDLLSQIANRASATPLNRATRDALAHLQRQMTIEADRL